MKYGIVVFPGSNCDMDAKYATSVNAGEESEFLWHKETSVPPDVDCVILPGGFSYGDYLRCGAIARFSPIMRAVKEFADKGGYVLGICNGFQILAESGMLPGALLKNKNLHFIRKDVYLKTANNSSPFTSSLKKGEILRLPIAHGEGNYYASEDVLKRLQDEDRIAFRYCDENGTVSEEANPNGSLDNIAGVLNEKGNVLGMMPHPERYCDPILGGTDGLKIFRSLKESLLNVIA